MNHEIQHYINIERARGGLADAMYFKIDRIVHVRLQRHERWIESFGMAHLQNRVTRLRRCDHLISFVDSARDRLFDQHVHARLKQSAGNFAMRFGRYRETDRIDFADQSAPIGRACGFSFRGDASRTLVVKIAHADEIADALSRERSMQTRMLRTEMSNSDNGGS